jgi:hypothetical protein
MNIVFGRKRAFAIAVIALCVSAALVSNLSITEAENSRREKKSITSTTGSTRAAEALKSGRAEARSLATADLNGDAAPDLVAGYEFNGIGIVTVTFGNIDGFAPADDSILVRIQAGYNPPSLHEDAIPYVVPETPDFLMTGDFNRDGIADVLFAARGGSLNMLAGDGTGKLELQEPISLPGPVASFSAGEFCAADGRMDIAVGVSTPDGDQLLIFDGVQGFEGTPITFPLIGAASAIEFSELDGDPFMDIVVANGSGVDLIHGWGRKVRVDVRSHIERIDLGGNIVSIAVDDFLWDRQGTPEIAALFDDGNLSLFGHSGADDQPYSERELADRAGLRGRVAADANRRVDVEALAARTAASAAASDWREVRQLAADINSSPAPGRRALTHGKLAGGETNPLLVIDAGSNTIKAISQFRGEESGRLAPDSTLSGDISTRTFAVKDASAVLILPKKINGFQDVVVLSSEKESPEILLLPPNTTITVDRTDDPSGAALTAASACTAAGSDCSLRGALQFANLPANDNTTISLPANTYILSINGTSQGGCDGNTVGDLGANRTMSIIGAGAATTIIRQTGNGPASDGDRIMCMNEPFTIGLVYNFSGVSFVGGREGTAAGTGAVLGGAGIIGGELNNSLTMTNVVMANNQETVAGSANLGGGGIQITGGNLIITNSTFGGTNLPGLYTDRANTNTGNKQAGSGGGVTYTPSSPQHAGGTGTLTITGSTFSRNTSTGIGGGGADLLIFAFAAPGGIGSGSASVGTSTFSNNQAANGGGIVIESLPTTVATTNITSNSASNRGGGIYLGGGSLLLNGTTPSITFTGNTATNAGSSVSTAAPVNVDGTNTTIGGDIEVSQGGTWTNNTGSTLAPTNVVVAGGVLNMNNSTMNVSGNLTIGPGGTNGGTFNGNTGTVNIQGNFVLNAGGVSPATNLSAGTGTFNFNGTGAQSITNGTAITFFNLTDSNITQPLTLNNSFGAGGTLNVNGANATLAPVANSVISGAGTLTGTGTVRVTRIAATADFLGQYTIANKTLTNLLVDYVGSATQVLSAITYGQLRINNGSGVNHAAGTSTVNGLLTLATGALAVGTNTLVINNGTSIGTGSITSAPTGTVNYNQGSAGQNVRAFNYGNLTFSNQNKVLANVGTIGIAGTFTPGTAVGHTITGSTIDFNGTGAQTIPAFSYNNLTISGAHAANNITLANGGTIAIAGAFSPTATFAGGVYVITNSTIDFNGAGSQTIPAFNYNNITSSNAGARTFAGAGTVGVAAVFTPGANVYAVTGSTVNFNGSVAQNIPAFNFNHLTSSNIGTRTLPNGGTVGVAGIFTPGTNVYTITGSTIDFNGGGSQAIPSFNYHNLTSSSVGPRTLANTGTIAVENVFTPGINVYTVTGSTVNFNGSVSQSIPAFNFNNLMSSNTGARILPNGGTVGIAGVFTPGANAYTITGSTVRYNGGSSQTMPATFTTYNNLTLANPNGVTGFAGLTVQGLMLVEIGSFTTASSFNNVQINVAANLIAQPASTINVTGNWVNNGLFTASTGTVIFNGAAPQSFGGSAFNNLTLNNAAGASLNGNATINGTLTLTSGLLDVGSNTLQLNGPVAAIGSINSNAGGTVNYHQAVAGQNILPGNYGNLGFTNLAKILPNGGTVSIAGIFTTGAAGGHTVTGSTVQYNGGVLQIMPAGFTAYENVTINNPAGVNLAANVTVNGILNFTNGTLNTGPNVVFVAPAGSSTRIAGHVIGNLEKQYSATGSFTFHVGTFGAYSPLNQTVTLGSGQLRVRANTGLPVATPIGLDPARTLQRYWSLSGSGIRSNITFNYLDTDIPGTTNENLWNIIRVTGNTVIRYEPTLPYVMMDPANNRFTINDVESYSDWTAGEPLAPTAASVNVSGRVTGGTGFGLSGVRIAMQDQVGNVAVALTNPFGFYSFTDVQVGQTYVVMPSHKGYNFQPRTITINDELTGLDFVAQP